MDIWMFSRNTSNNEGNYCDETNKSDEFYNLWSKSSLHKDHFFFFELFTSIPLVPNFQTTNAMGIKQRLYILKLNKYLSMNPARIHHIFP